MSKRVISGLTLAGILLAAPAVFGQDQGKKKGGPPPPPFTMTLPAVKDGATMPIKFTCSNAPAGTSPLIQWTNTPAGTESFAILLHDPEPHPGKGVYDVTHWFMWNIPGTAKELPEGLPAQGELPDGSKQMKRGNPPNQTVGYFGPCAPPTAAPHHYTFELYALDTKLDLSADATRADAMKAMDGHILGAAIYVTMFKREQ